MNHLDSEFCQNIGSCLCSGSTYPAGTVRTMYVHCTYGWYNVRTLYVHCTYSARWVSNSSVFMKKEISQFNVYIMSNLNIPGMFRPEGCRNVHFWCMTFQSTLNIHVTSNKNIPGMLEHEHC